jgi:hypothetical protein
MRGQGSGIRKVIVRLIQNPKLALSVAVGEASPLAIVSKIQNAYDEF